MKADQLYDSSLRRLPGSAADELIKLARKEFHVIQKRTPRRQAHIRSRYFTKDKVFINQFWDHLEQKNRQDKVRRLRLYVCAIDLIRNTTIAPVTMQNPNNSDEALHRFAGKTADGEIFYVQVKENKKNNRKDFMSVFPAK
jgi:hypothetical protein